MPLVFPLLTRLGPDPPRLLEAELDVPAKADPTDPESERTAQRKARAAVALLRLGRPEKVWPLFAKARDGRIRSYLIHWSRPLGVDRQVVIQHCKEEIDVGRRGALLFLLGEFPDAAWPEGQRAAPRRAAPGDLREGA